MSMMSLSHYWIPGMQGVPVLPTVETAQVLDIDRGDAIRVQNVSAPSHMGTHIDAPSHTFADGRTIDEYPLERFIGSAVISSPTCSYGTAITVDDILAGGPEPKRGDMLLIHTGWGAKFGDPSYFNHPSLDESVAVWAAELGLGLIGMDLLTPELPAQDRDASFAFQLHRGLLGADVLIAENLVFPHIEERRVRAVAAPVALAGGDAGWTNFVVEW
ncbi:cyclase family protein [Paeniglutamicibacter sp. NPDC012692]|uniref:cyclase family protein n=1 Tax=Paeniglutamicibacter sp. NPDC012692 TaxID=3364388 RepID=UPI0036772A5A